MLNRTIAFLLEYLRINAIRRMLTIVDVRRAEIVGLVLLALVFAGLEGMGLTLLLPILQFAENGQTAITESSGALWRGIGVLIDAVGLPVTLPVLLSLAFVPILLRQAAFYLNAWYSAVVSGRIGVRMRMRAFDAVVNADPEFYARHAVGKLTGVVLSQTNLAVVAVVSVIRQLSVALLIILYLTIMLALSVPLTGTMMLFGIVILLIVRTNTNKIKTFGVEHARISQETYAKIIERLGLIRLIKLRHQEEAESDQMRDYTETMKRISIKQARLGALIEITADPILMLAVFITMYVGISVLGMALSQLGLMLFVVSRLTTKVKEFNAGLQAISANMAGIILFKEMVDDADASDTIRGGAVPFRGLSQGVELGEVAFDYPATAEEDGTVSDSTPVLRDISVTMPAGSFTAIVGRSGAGKSTLVELLPRLREATSGSVAYDGTDIRDFDLGSLRRAIGYLTQDAMLFNDTVRSNLTYGLTETPSEDQIRTALEQAYATFVYKLPAGLETRLGDRGVRFSGGEQQRLALARVLLADTPVVILDEPTSALDSESEAFIQKALAALHGDKTIIVIAHRLATVVQADQLLVLEDGRIVERGTHSELVANEGPYHKLFESQLLA